MNVFAALLLFYNALGVTSTPFLNCSQVLSSLGRGVSRQTTTEADVGGARKTESMIDGHLTLSDELHENRVVPTDGQPKAVLIFLNDHASLNQPWRKGENKKREKLSYEGAMKMILLD